MSSAKLISKSNPARWRKKMKRILIGLFMTAIFIYFLPAVGAQDLEAVEDDIFDTEAFDESVDESRATEEENRIEYLIGGNLLLDSRFVTTTKFDNYSTDGRFSGKSLALSLKPTSLRYSIDFSLISFSSLFFLGKENIELSMPELVLGCLPTITFSSTDILPNSWTL